MLTTFIFKMICYRKDIFFQNYCYRNDFFLMENTMYCKNIVQKYFVIDIIFYEK